MHDSERIKSSSEAVNNIAGAFGEMLTPGDGERFPNIEDTKEYKAREKGFPTEGNGDESNQLPGDLVDDDKLWIFRGVIARHPGCGRNSNKRHHGGCDC